MTDTQTPKQFDSRARQELFDRRILILDGTLDDDNGTLLITQLIALAASDPQTDISFWLHSPGGSIPSMMAIRDVMQIIPNDVSTLALGLACSAGQFLLSAGTKGKRQALPHSRILLHQGSSGIGGSAVDVGLQADDLRLTRDTVLGLIAEDTGQSPEKVFADSQHDHWFSSAEALDYGFIDSLATTFLMFQPAPRSTTGFTMGGRA